MLYIKNGFIVRSESFHIHQNIGNIVNEASRYNTWDVDELIYIDISREKKYDLRRDDHKIASYNSIEEIISKISKVCFMPLTFGGGIRLIEDIDVRIQNGADKITLNTGALDDLTLMTKASKKYGAQCVVLSIDYRMVDGQQIVFSNFGETKTDYLVKDWVKICEDSGAGEIFLNSIDRDGMANGYDIRTIQEIETVTNLPLIVCGGAGNEYDIVECAIKTNASAIAVGNWFHFVENSYQRAKKALKRKKINVR